MNNIRVIRIIKVGYGITLIRNVPDAHLYILKAILLEENFKKNSRKTIKGAREDVLFSTENGKRGIQAVRYKNIFAMTLAVVFSFGGIHTVGNVNIINLIILVEVTRISTAFIYGKDNNCKDNYYKVDFKKINYKKSYEKCVIK